MMFFIKYVLTFDDKYIKLRLEVVMLALIKLIIEGFSFQAYSQVIPPRILKRGTDKLINDIMKGL